jgi:hypothetical protein
MRPVSKLKEMAASLLKCADKLEQQQHEGKSSRVESGGQEGK